MANVRIPVKNTKLKMETTPATFVDIGGVTSISGPNESYEEMDVTDFDSTAKEYEAALPDSGTANIGLNLDPDSTTQASLRAAKGTTKNFKIVLNDATATKTIPSEFAFAAIVKDLGNEMNVGDIVKQTIALRITGPVTFTARHA